MEVFLEVTLQHKKYHAGFMERMRQQPEVTSCYQVEGEYDFLVKADVTSEKELEKLERSVRKINGSRRDTAAGAAGSRKTFAVRADVSGSVPAAPRAGKGVRAISEISRVDTVY